MLTLYADALELEILSTAVGEYNTLRLEVLVTNPETQSVALTTYSPGLSDPDFDVEHNDELIICHNYTNQHPMMKTELEPGAQVHITLYYPILKADPGSYQLSLYLRFNEEQVKKKPFRLQIERPIEIENQIHSKQRYPI